MKKIIPNKLNIGDTIGVVAPSAPISKENILELEMAKEKLINDRIQSNICQKYI